LAATNEIGRLNGRQVVPLVGSGSMWFSTGLQPIVFRPSPSICFFILVNMAMNETGFRFPESKICMKIDINLKTVIIFSLNMQDMP
jgi:hypothetical protein